MQELLKLNGGCDCVRVAHREMKREMTECVLHGVGHCCHSDSVTHGSLI